MKTLASCTTSVYVNLSKNSLFHRPQGGCFPKADAKVRLFSELPKLFQEKFRCRTQFFVALDVSQSDKRLTPYLYI